jgi:hypothetical protein
VKNKLIPKWTTVVGPEEYDIKSQMEYLVKIHNKSKENWIPQDVGKIIGLYNDWKELKEIIKKFEDDQGKTDWTD